MYLAIDPGIDTGWALWRDADTLVACGCSDPRVKVTTQVGSMIIEQPAIYRARMSKGNPNNLVVLAIQVGRYLEHFEARGAKTNQVIPHDWKGTLPKDIHHARIWAAMTPGQQAIVSRCGELVAPSKRHNMLDALALGSWAFKSRAWA